MIKYLKKRDKNVKKSLYFAIIMIILSLFFVGCETTKQRIVPKYFGDSKFLKIMFETYGNDVIFVEMENHNEFALRSKTLGYLVTVKYDSEKNTLEEIDKKIYIMKMREKDI